MRKLVPFIAIRLHDQHAHPLGEVDRLIEHKRLRAARLARSA
jgi:hypothetical protein